MDCVHQRGLCVPEYLASSILQKGFTDVIDANLNNRLIDLMAQAVPRCRAVTPLDSGMVWLTPYVVVGDGSSHACFVSRHKETDAAFFEPFSLGLTGHCRESETADMAAARILYELVGTSVHDVIQADLAGLVWLNRSRFEATHIAIVYKVRVNILHDHAIDRECFKGKWMSMEDIFGLFHYDALTPWSKYLLRRQGMSGLFARLEATPVLPAISETITQAF